MAAGWDFREGDEIAAGLRAAQLLGGGHRYEAWLAFEEKRRAFVVAKLLRPDQVGDAAALRILGAEARLLRRLSHPMLLRSYGAVLDGERPHVVLEHIAGPRLSTLIRRYGVALEQLLPLAVNVCAVLHYLAHERVVHLDVKPRNIIMGGEPRLIDMSVARAFDELHSIRQPIGTDAYMAPEQCDPARFAEIGPPADVWGLGVTLYEALARRRPFEGDGYRQLRATPRPLPGRLPPPVTEAVMACLERRPADRPSAADLADALEPVAAGLPAPKIGPFRPGGQRMLDELTG
jgi:eukaryotic-like serine/threonine-protein kinase